MPQIGWKKVRDFRDLTRIVTCQLWIPDYAVKVRTLELWWRADMVFVLALNQAVAGVSVYDPLCCYIPGRWTHSPSGIDLEMSGTFARGLHYCLRREVVEMLQARECGEF